MDDLDRSLVNHLQEGLPLTQRPFDGIAEELGIDVAEVLGRLQRMLDDRVLSRFGPMYNAEKLGGAVTLCAMQVPEDRFEEIAERVNAFPEVAHNYARNHTLNMWFVIATEQPQRIGEVIAAIESGTGCRVYDLPKQEEFYVGLRLAV
jgi:DNA-binding Lrp family transcriptional regulator